MLQFKNIEIDDIEIYKKYSRKIEDLSCENSFANLIIWQSVYCNMIVEKDGLLFIKSTIDGEDAFRLPLGDDFEKGLFEIYRYCGDKKPCFWAEEGNELELFKAYAGEDYYMEESRESFDYIYLREDLAALSGKKYHAKRNHISAFSKKFDWHYRKITDENINDIKEGANEWYRENAYRADIYMRCEKKGVEAMLDNMQKLGVKGGAVYVGEKPVAFTLGTAINETCFDIHAEKALEEYAEAYAVINNEFVKNELSDYKYINREDDMGIEGLRKAKLSYKPYMLLKKYNCIAVKNDDRK